MLDRVFALNQTLRCQLTNLLQGGGGATGVTSCRFTVTERSGPLSRGTSLNVVITGNEVNNLHGTGPLVKRVCHGWPNILSIRARSDWGGVQDFGDWHVCLEPRATTRAAFFRNVVELLSGYQVESALCIPFLQDEFYTAIAIHECFGGKLCAYLMDDQNIAAQKIPDTLMREFLERCSLRLATHPELQSVYQQKYGMPFHVLPAIVPSQLVPERASLVGPQEDNGGALIGSFWDQSWFDRLCAALSGTGRRIDWFGNNKSPWFDLSPRTLERAGIVAHGIIPEDELARRLVNYPFVVVPVGALDRHDANTGVARLSLPGRILFAIATSQTPVLIVGSPQTCGARFVNHFGVGEVVPYEAGAVAAAMERMAKPAAQERMRQAAARIAPVLSDRGVARWLRESIDLGAPADRRFEELFSGYDACLDLQTPTAAMACS